MARRRTHRLHRALAIVIVAALAFAAWVAVDVFVDSYRPYRRTITIPVAGLTQPVSVLQVTDLGALEFGSRQSLLGSLMGGEHFDAVVFTGDMGSINRHSSLGPVWDLAAVAKAHSSRVWYLPGNHDTPAVGAGLAARGVPTLPQDRAVALSDSDPAAHQLALVYGRTAATIAAAAGRGKTLLVIASHTPPDPNRIAAAQQLGGGTHLFIAGHTHGGQIRLPVVGAIEAPLSWADEQRAPAKGNEITWWPELKGRLVDGMYHRAGQLIFVSRGLESSAGGHQRFLDRAEIVVYRFVPAAGR